MVRHEKIIQNLILQLKMDGTNLLGMIRELIYIKYTYIMIREL